ncbi:hypothetical protein PCASD_13183 [Puccinia coronata f. sp. avenae]|uniref:DNA polymerase beta n=1 Tax=Puccinia coronata f. sp. avenae TaxID=200324 RepID=A0A2N5T2H8_9BASI|nr:hypothetical protein PCASD_13183 [Puccinia coronata f. sp. avenae]
MDSSQNSLKRSYHELATSRKRVASSPADTFDSESTELHQWQQSSIAWKKSYDKKVAQCLAQKQLPIGPFEQYLKLNSPIRVEDEGPDNMQTTHPSIAPALPSSISDKLKKTWPERVVLAPETPVALLAPETPGVLLVPKTPSILLAPETPTTETPTCASSFHLVEKASIHIASPKSSLTHQIAPRSQAKKFLSHDLVSLENDRPSAHESHNAIGMAQSRSEISDRFGLDRTISETSASSLAKMKNMKLSRRGSKSKEIDTLDAYDKLSARERTARFPRVQIWADFLTQTIRITPKRHKLKDFMKRCRIYYLLDPKIQQNLDDADRMRMRKLFEAGAQIQPELKAKQVTHIIVRDGTSWNACLRAIKSLVDDPLERQKIKEMCLASIDKIPGQEPIWIMDFKWITSCLSHGAIPAEKYTCIRPRASKTLRPPTPIPIRSPESQNANRSAEAEHNNDSSYDEIETSMSLQQNVHSMVQKPKPTERSVPGLESQLQLARLGEGMESDESEVEELEWEAHPVTSIPAIPVRKTKGKTRPGYDRPGSGTSKKNGPNEDICQNLEKIIELYGSSQNDNFRTLAFRKAVNILRAQTKRLDDIDMLRKLEGIGPKMAQKILEIANTNTHRRLQLATDQDVCRTLFKGIYGVDDHLAHKWYSKGLRTLGDVRDRKDGIVLSPAQELGLRFFDDLQERVPRKEADLIFNQVNQAAIQVDSQLKLFLVGSFRRGEESCEDIHIILTREDPGPDGITYHDSMLRLYVQLKKDGLITHELSTGKKAEKNNPMVLLCLCAINQPGFSKQRRLYLRGVPCNQLGAALIYFTGNEIFNRSLRLKARHMGYTLTQQGLFKSSPSAFHSKFNDLLTPSITNEFNHSRPPTTMVASKTEEEIFKILEVPFLFVLFH